MKRSILSRCMATVRLAMVFAALTVTLAWPGVVSASPVNLGTSGPAYYSVLSLGGGLSFTQTDVVIDSGASTGNIGIAAKAASNPTSDLQITNPGTLIGNIYLQTNATLVDTGAVTGTAYAAASSNQVTGGSNVSGGVVVNGSVNTRLNTAVSNAQSFAQSYAALSCTLCSYTTFSNPSSNQTIVGTNGTNVVNLTDLKFNGKNLTLSATGNLAQFIINVSGTFNFNQANLNLAGDLTPDEVLINYTGSNEVQAAGTTPNLISAIILAEHASIGFSNTRITGEVISGGPQLRITSGSYVHRASGQAPEPGSLLLLSSGIAAMGWRVRRRSTRPSVQQS